MPYFFNFSERPSKTFSKLRKALRNPRDAVAVINAQLHLRGKAKLPLSVRLTGRIILTGEGQVELGNGVSFVGNVVPIEIASRKGARISIGDHTFINYGSSISACKHIEIGHHCFLGHHTFLLANKEYGVEQDDLPSSPSIMIGDHAWIGSHVTVLPGVSIGHHAAVGAGSVVTKSIPPHCLAVGNPARVVRQFEQVNQLSGLQSGSPPSSARQKVKARGCEIDVSADGRMMNEKSRARRPG